MKKIPLKIIAQQKLIVLLHQWKANLPFFIKAIIILKSLITWTQSLHIVETKDKLGIECVPHEYWLWSSIQMFKKQQATDEIFFNRNHSFNTEIELILFIVLKLMGQYMI